MFLSWEERLAEVYSSVEIHDLDSSDIAQGERTLEFNDIKKSWWDNYGVCRSNGYKETCFEHENRNSNDYCGYLRNDRFINRSLIVNPDDCSTIVNHEPVQVMFESAVERPGMWKLFSSLNCVVTPGSVQIQHGKKKQSFRVSILEDKDAGLVQMIATDNLKYPGAKYYFAKNHLLNLYLHKNLPPVVPQPYVSIHPETTQIYCPILEGQIANIILPKGSDFNYVKNKSLYKLDQSRSPYNEAMCVYLLCYSPIDDSVIMTFKSEGRGLFSGAKKSSHGAVFFPRTVTSMGDRWAIISDPIETFTFVRNQCRGFILRTTNEGLGRRQGSLDKNRRFIIESRTNGINTTTREPFWELRVICDRPTTNKLSVVIKNLYSPNDCEAI